MPYNMAPSDVRELLEGYCLESATSFSLTGDITTGSNIMSNVTTTNVKYMMKVTGTGIPSGTFVAAVNPSGGSLQLSQPAESTLVGASFTFTQYDQVSDGWLVNCRDYEVLPWIERRLGFSLRTGVGHAVEYRSGTGSSIIILSRRPVISVEKITLVTNPSNWIYVSPSSVNVIGDEGILKLRAVLEAWTSYVPAFPRGKDNMIIEYTYGYANCPDELARAVNCLVASRALGHIGARTGGGNVNVPGISRSYGERGKYEQVRIDLERWAYATIRDYSTGTKGS